MGAEIEKKPVENEVRKTMRKRAHMQDGSVACGGRLLSYRLVLVSFSSRFGCVVCLVFVLLSPETPSNVP